MLTSQSQSTFRVLSRLTAVSVLFTFLTCSAFAQTPGTVFPESTAISDQQTGSVLIYNYYTSSSSNPGSENTRFHLTNTSDTEDIAVHLFFLDGETCSPADFFICLTPNQTWKGDAGELDPGVMGYAIAIAVEPSGCPRKFNHLIGDLYVKTRDGFAANLAAVAVKAINLGTVCQANASEATLKFDDLMYGRLPGILAASSIPSSTDGNKTLLILNNPSGSLVDGANSIGPLYGILYDQLENPYSFTLSAGCFRRIELNDSTMRTAPRLSRIIPQSATGWMRIFAIGKQPISGAMIVFNPTSATNPNSYSQGRNLHILSSAAQDAEIVMPVITSNCS